jgi:hypothetical protein
MAIPLVDFNIEENIELIMKTASIAPGHRKKPLLATVKGQGSGKTRAFEELRRRLFVEPACFPMCITFNCNWGIGNDEKNLVGMEYSRDFAFMMSVFMRMASIFFNASLTEVIKTINDYKDKEFFLQSYDRDVGKQLIQDFIKYMIRRCGRENEVKTVVVLVDEVCCMLYAKCLFQYIFFFI